MIKSVGALINPFKESYDVKYQLLPTINLMYRENFIAWLQLRSCVMDFGRKYIMRVFMYSSVFLALYLSITVMLLISFFGIISIKFSFFFNLVCVYDIIIVLGVITSMFYYGAVINEEFI